MRNLYFLLFFSLFAHLPASAQRKVNLQMLGTRFGTTVTNMQQMAPYQRLSYDNKTGYFFGFVLKNLGPDPLQKWDTVSVIYVGGTVYTGNHFTANAGDTIVFTPNLSDKIFFRPLDATIGESDTMYWCDTVRVAAAPTNTPLVDPDMSNNQICHFVEAYYGWPVNVSKLPETNNTLQIFPNPATTLLTITCDNRTHATASIVLRNVLGMEVYRSVIANSTSGISHTADVSHLPRGLYTAELRYNDRTLVEKFSIQ